MILQALKEYYDRKADALPPVGWIEKGIDYVLVLRPDGSLQQLECLQEGEGKNTTSFPSVAPLIGKQAVKHTNSGDDANLLWDNTAFVFGLKNNAEKKRESFVKAIKTWLSDTDDVGVLAVLAFYDALTEKPELLKSIVKHKEYGENISSGSPIVTFRLEGDSCRFVYERPVVKDAVASKWSQLTENSGRGICLITGDETEIEKCHVVIKGVWGGQSSGGTIVGYNASAFTSYGKDQGANGPVGKAAAFSYTTALNHLLRPDSENRIQVGDASTVFWGERASSLEAGFVDIFGEPPKDDPDRGTRAVKSLYQSVQSGTLVPDEAMSRFYVLGLAPNASRIAIRFWHVDTVARLSEKLVQHFEDLHILHGSLERDVISLSCLLLSTAALGKAENIPPNLAGDTMRAIIEGLPYPQTLLNAAIRRIRAEQAAKDRRTGKAIPNVTYVRAALIKACINRRTRFERPEIEEELKVSLDTANTNIGYRLGRLFAVLEKIQAEANPGINATIRDRFYGAASGTPVAVFSNLMRLKNHHLAKLQKPGRRVHWENLIGTIVSGFGDFPAHLSLADQGRFAIGYYHQQQEFYQKKNVVSNDNNKVQKTEGTANNE